MPEEAKKNFEEEYQQKIKNYKDVAAACKANKQGEGQKKHSQKKQVGAPKRPAGGAYGCFVASKRVEFQAEFKRQGLQVTAVSTMAGKEWKALPEEKTKPFVEEYHKKLGEYRAEVATCNANVKKGACRSSAKARAKVKRGTRKAACAITKKPASGGAPNSELGSGDNNSKDGSGIEESKQGKDEESACPTQKKPASHGSPIKRHKRSHDGGDDKESEQDKGAEAACASARTAEGDGALNSRAEAGVENSRDASGQNESQHENETGAPAGRLAC